MSEPTVMEGYLRVAGDGYECSDLYLDNVPLQEFLSGVLSHHRYRGHHWVVGERYADDASHLPMWSPHPYAEELGCRHEDKPFIERLSLQVDFGRVRITVESLDVEEEVTGC